MKRTLLFGLLGLAATAAPSFGQGVIILDNYDSYGPNVTYGSPGIPANGTSGPFGTVGAAVIGNPTGTTSPWTVGVYFAIGDVTGSIASDPTHLAVPSTLGGGLILGTGPGSTAGVDNINAPVAGEFIGNAWGVPGTSAAGGQTLTLELIVYNNSSYDTATFRGHSDAFTIVTSANTATTPSFTGTLMPSLSVWSTPEPSVSALTAFGFAALFIARNRRRLKELRIVAK